MSGKYTWEDMELCKTCHFADEDPSICRAWDKAKEKPGPMKEWPDDCGRYISESKWKRMEKAKTEK